MEPEKHKTVAVTTRYWPTEGVKSEVFRARFPDLEKLLAMAEVACSGRFQFWHPWHMELTHEPFSARNGLKLDWTVTPNGDIEWSHSLLRFTHMLDWAVAYRLTGNQRYLRCYGKHFSTYLHDRRNGDKCWENRLNAAIRLINLIKSYDLISDDSSLTETEHHQHQSAITTEAEFVFAGLSEKLGNWAFFFTTSLLIACEFLPERAQNREWREAASKRLHAIIATEILPDGMLIEAVPMYHGQVIIALLDYLLILKTNNRSMPPAIVSLVWRMGRALCDVCDPEGFIPPIGDSDRFPVDYIDDFCRAVLGKGFNSLHCSETEPNNLALCSYPDTGWQVCRWRDALQKSNFLLFDVSGKPPAPRNWHSHADDLQVLFHTNEGPVLTDPGRFTYASVFRGRLPLTRREIYPRGKLRLLYALLSPKLHRLNRLNWRAYFNRTLAHNTVSFRAKNQPGYASSAEPVQIIREEPSIFGSLMLTEGKLKSVPEVAERQKYSYSHKRTVLCLTPCFVIICDQLQADQLGEWTCSFHFGSNIKPTSIENGWLLENGHGTVYQLESFATHPELIKRQLDDDWISPLYNRKYPSKTGRIISDKSARLDLVSVLVTDPALTKESLYHVELERKPVDFSGFLTLSLKHAEKYWRIFLKTENGIKGDNLMSTDAQLTTLLFEKERLTEIGFLKGSFVQYRDKRYESTIDEDGALYRIVPDTGK